MNSSWRILIENNGKPVQSSGATLKWPHKHADHRDAEPGDTSNVERFLQDSSFDWPLTGLCTVSAEGEGATDL
ncbi:hypothetical protein JOB18_040182 [Solea senegalensis]|uniref:Uncharacterized protein n=1 Tax=Solea senegalensis TaxID=28829 RepID=A0AAV6RUA1_SOLSE|nr:hypothetical protein JOB18_040182 [Solea senegalensis]